MPDEVSTPNSITPAVRNRSRVQGDVPETIRRRYFLDGRGGAGLGFYVDAQIQAPAFRDQGRKLATARNDPNAIRDMIGIAQHRGWTIVAVSGSQPFRREAWLASRSAGLEVRGYQPTDRDLQHLARRTEQRQGSEERAQASLKIVETVVRSRLATPNGQERLLQMARERIADWLERGAKFDGFQTPTVSRGREPRQRERSR